MAFDGDEGVGDDGGWGQFGEFVEGAEPGCPSAVLPDHSLDATEHVLGGAHLVGAILEASEVPEPGVVVGQCYKHSHREALETTLVALQPTDHLTSHLALGAPLQVGTCQDTAIGCDQRGHHLRERRLVALEGRETLGQRVIRLGVKELGRVG